MQKSVALWSVDNATRQIFKDKTYGDYSNQS